MIVEATLYTVGSKGYMTLVRSKWLQIALIWLITVIVFWPSFRNGFQVEWDDQWMLIDHELVLNHTWENIRYYFTHYVNVQYFPLKQIVLHTANSV